MLLVGLREAGDAIAPADASACGHHLDPNMASKLGFCAPVNATGNDLEDEAFAASHKFRPHRRPVRPLTPAPNSARQERARRGRGEAVLQGSTGRTQ